VANSTSKAAAQQPDAPDWAVDPADQQYADNLPGTDVAHGQVVDAQMLEAMGPATMQVIQWCVDQVSVDDDDSALAMEDMIRRVLASETPDQVFAEDLPISAQDILGKPIVITGVRIGQTDFADGFPFYALVDVEIGSPPQKRVVTVGAFKVMAQLFALARLGEWPQTAMFKQSDKPTRKGNRPLSLVRAA
jgi:hypothetical protein